MEMKSEHTAIRRGVSWSPGGLRKPLQATQDVHTPGTECSALWEKTDFNKEQMSQKTNLTRSASLSEKELKDARVRSHLIASQLTVPSNSNSRGVQLFNRRKQRVSAFTLESSGGRSQEDKERSVKTDPSTNKPTCAERRNSEENDRNLNLKNGSTKILFPSPLRVPAVGDIMEEPNKDYNTEGLKDSIILERHFLPVKEEQEEEIHHSKVEDEVLLENKTDPILVGSVEREVKIMGGQTGTVTLNGCHSTSTSDRATTIVNRTARPFFSPPPVQSPEATSPIMDIPPPPSYDTPPLPTFTAPEPVTFSPPPPPPSYPTPPLPAFTNQPPQAYYTSPPPMSPVMSPTSPPPSQFPVSSISRYPPMPHYGPPTAAKPSTSAPEPLSERKTVSPIKTGVLEDGTTRRATRKSMFTFKEKPVVAPNPELLSLVQGVDEKKKHQHKSVPEPTSEEELMALGAEASNFLAKEEARVEEAKAPEWTSCLRSSRTRPRAEHRPEQNLTNVSGKGAELFAKRQSRMEKYVVEQQDANRMRAPSPTMSLPPSWVYPSNMPGRVKAIVKNTDISAQLSHNPKSQQVAKPKQRPKAPVPEPAPEPPLENGCSKIEMDLSRHQPYQIDPSLFTFSPVQDPVKYLPKRAPQAKNQKFGKPLSRQASLPSRPPTQYRPRCISPQQLPNPRGTAEPEATTALVQPRISSAMAAFSPERVSSPRSAIQAPRPTFCAKKAGIEAQTPTDSATVEACQGTTEPSRTLSFTRRSSSPESATSGTWTSSLQINCPSNTTASSSNRSLTAPMSPPPVTRCLSPLTNQNTHISNTDPTPIFRPTVTSPCSPRWGSKCQSPAISKNTCSSVSNATSRPTYKSTTTFPASPPWGSRCQSPIVSHHTSTNISSSMSRPSQTTSPISPPWGSRCQSPMTSPSAATANFNSASKPFQTQSTTSPVSPPWSSRCQSPMVNQSAAISSSTSKTSPTTPITTSPMSPPWGSRSQSPAPSHSSLSFSATKPLYTSSATSPISPSKDSRCMSPVVNNLDSKANHRLLAKNIINAAKRKNSPSPGALSGHSFPISPLGNSHHGYDCQKPPTSPFQSRALGARSPIFTSPPPTPTQRICSPVRLYNTRSLTDSDASIESEDSGLRSPGLHSYNTCPRGWGGSLRVKRSTVSTDL